MHSQSPNKSRQCYYVNASSTGIFLVPHRRSLSLRTVGMSYESLIIIVIICGCKAAHFARQSLLLSVFVLLLNTWYSILHWQSMGKWCPRNNISVTLYRMICLPFIIFCHISVHFSEPLPCLYREQGTKDVMKVKCSPSPLYSTYLGFMSQCFPNCSKFLSSLNTQPSIQLFG